MDTIHGQTSAQRAREVSIRSTFLQTWLCVLVSSTTSVAFIAFGVRAILG